MPKEIAILGPESTGKTALAESLAKIFGVEAIPEYARQYLKNFSRKYTIDDVVEIAKGQQQLIDDKRVKKESVLISDTELIVCKIWTKYVYNTVPEFIADNILKQKFDVYLLCDIDLEWENDPLRENPKKSEREELFEMYKVELEKMNANYRIVSGFDKKRVQNALYYLKEFGIVPPNE